MAKKFNKRRFALQLDAITKKAVRKVTTVDKEDIRDEIVATIISGVSPVKNFGRFKEYTDDYAREKGVRPVDVDMVRTGEMLKSFKVTQKKVNQLTFRFDSKIATFHNEKGIRRRDKGGRIRLVRRRLLPIKDETFKSDIIKLITNLVKRAFNRTAR